ADRPDLADRHHDGTVVLVLAQERDQAVGAHRAVPVGALGAVDPQHPPVLGGPGIEWSDVGWSDVGWSGLERFWIVDRGHRSPPFGATSGATYPHGVTPAIRSGRRRACATPLHLTASCSTGAMVDDTGSDSKATTRRVVIAVLVLLVAIGAVAIWLVRRGGDDSSATTTTSVATTDTSADPTEPGSSTSTSSATAPADDATATAVWPRSDTARRFEDPVAAARSFAVDFAVFADPVLGEFRQGDSRSGEVEVRPQADGPV